MHQNIGHVAVVVRDYDEALAFYVGTLGFEVVEDTWIHAQHKRWVLVRPAGSHGTHLLLAQAANDRQVQRIGDQTGGRVFLFLHTDDFWRDYRTYCDRGVELVRDPVKEPYGVVAVFRDVCGNLWDLIEPCR